VSKLCLCFSLDFSNPPLDFVCLNFLPPPCRAGGILRLEYCDVNASSAFLQLDLKDEQRSQLEKHLRDQGEQFQQLKENYDQAMELYNNNRQRMTLLEVSRCCAKRLLWWWCFFALVFCFFVSKPFFQAPFFHFVWYTVPAQQSALLSELNMRSIQAAFPLRKFYTEKKFVLVSMNIFRLS